MGLYKIATLMTPPSKCLISFKNLTKGLAHKMVPDAENSCPCYCLTLQYFISKRPELLIKDKDGYASVQSCFDF